MSTLLEQEAEFEAKKQQILETNLRIERLIREARKDEATMRNYLERKRLLRRLRASEARNKS